MSFDKKNSETTNTSGRKDITAPTEIKKWNWGAFLLSWVWAIAHKTWIGLIALIPFVIIGVIAPFTNNSNEAAGLFIITFGVMLVLGIKGNAWAWQNNKWESTAEFLRVQRRWSRIALIIIGALFILGFIVGFVLSVSTQPIEMPAEFNNTAIDIP